MVYHGDAFILLFSSKSRLYICCYFYNHSITSTTAICISDLKNDVLNNCSFIYKDTIYTFAFEKEDCFVEFIMVLQILGKGSAFFISLDAIQR